MTLHLYIGTYVLEMGWFRNMTAEILNKNAHFQATMSEYSSKVRVTGSVRNEYRSVAQNGLFLLLKEINLFE